MTDQDAREFFELGMDDVVEDAPDVDPGPDDPVDIDEDEDVEGDDG